MENKRKKIINSLIAENNMLRDQLFDLEMVNAGLEVLLKSIRKLRIVALFLFIFPAFAIIGSLVIHNYLVSFKYSKDTNYNFETNLSGSSIEILCFRNLPEF